MRINAFVARATGTSRRRADQLLKTNQIKINGLPAKIGSDVNSQDKVTLNDNELKIPKKSTTLMLNKPEGYVVSRIGQGSKTIYELIPKKYFDLKPVGRLDKNSSGLLLLSNDGQLTQKLTHPSFNKQKIYIVKLNKFLKHNDEVRIMNGIKLFDGISQLTLSNISSDRKIMTVTMSEGRNRQIRRTFESLHYRVTSLKRISFGDYSLGELSTGKWKIV